MNLVHPIPLPTPEEAVRLQERMASNVSATASPGSIRYVGACDVAYDDRTAYAAVVVWDSRTSRIVERASWIGEPAFPYVPGLFAFREAAALQDALKAVAHPVDVLLVDGHGIAHPRRFGVASHLGWAFATPAIGCAKTLLCGRHREPGTDRGAAADLVDGEDVIGCALRTQTGVKPVYVSVGHAVDLPTARARVLEWSPRYRIPEPLRQAHRASIELRAGGSGS